MFPHWEHALQSLFIQQEQATIARLTGKRGRQAARADMTPAFYAGAIFDAPFWTTKMVETLEPLHAAIGVLAKQQVIEQLALNPDYIDDASQAAVDSELRSRAQILAQRVTKTTHEQIGDALAAGLANGASTDEHVEAIHHVFDVARDSRAATTARTEVVGAMNGAAHQFAINQPTDRRPEEHTWYTRHDGRMRPSHKRLDGVTLPIHEPFHMTGGHHPQYPGDPVLPPEHAINCACYVTYSPARVAQPATLATTGG
jgi:uncharacterized protein with gpF-like domain